MTALHDNGNSPAARRKSLRLVVLMTSLALAATSWTVASASAAKGVHLPGGGRTLLNPQPLPPSPPSGPGSSR
jgi:hypothetical protein